MQTMRPAGMLLAAGLLIATPSWTAGPPLGTLETHTLKNGLRLVLLPDEQAPAVDVSVWYDAGSRHDKNGRSGVAHLFEHLMFRGSKSVRSDEHASLVRGEGGTSGSFAGHDFTCFFQSLPPEALELAFRLEADRMNGLALTQAALDQERRQVADERARRGALAAGLEHLYGMAYSGHPYGTPVFGLQSEVAKITLQDLRDFYRDHYGPSRAVVIVAGRFDRQQALSLARKHFEPLPALGRSSSSKAPAVRPQNEERRRTERLATSVPVLMVGWRAPGREDPDWPALSLIPTLLTRAADAPLSRSLIVERPLCLSLSGDLDSRRDGSLLFVSAAVRPEADSVEVETALFKELGRLLVQPVADRDLQRAKRQIELAAWFGLQTARGRGQAAGRGQMVTGDPRDLEKQLDRIRGCTPQDIMRAARRLDPARRNVLWLTPLAPSSATGAASSRGGR